MMTHRSAARTYDRFVQGPNFMTENRVECGWFGSDYVYELADGRFGPDYLVGVSVRHSKTGEIVRFDEFKSIWIGPRAMSEAQAAIATVKGQYP